MPVAAGYSATPLAKKLGIKEGATIRLIHPPEFYFDLFADWPENVTVARKETGTKNLIHFFVHQEKELVKLLPALKNEIAPDGCIWVSWPKKAAKVPTDITEDVIRNFALQIGLVDIKVCAVDATWSGLKLVIPVALRKKA